MCGITGQLRFDDKPVDRRLVKRMADSLSHRGPDGEGYYFSRRVGLGSRRLAIIDLEGGDQPVLGRGRSLCLVSNNEIYNHTELRSELEAKGRVFRSSCDSEVILRLFEEGGERSFRRLEGMFAFAIWDDAEETLYLARDPFGIKPLYYYRDSTVFLFASEMRSLLEYPALDRGLDLEALDAYFGSLALPEPRTVFRKVGKLPAGHFLKVRGDKVCVERYWEPRFAPSSASSRGRAIRGGELERELRERLERTVKVSMRSDVPVGLLLSGGVDSSSVAAFAARLSGKPLHTFSASFSEGEFDESPFSRLVAKSLGTRHHEVRVTKGSATRIASRLTELMDEPFADSSSVPTYAVCELASRHVKTVLSGEGADELFGGYPWHLPEAPKGKAWDSRALAEHPTRVIFAERERAALYSDDWKGELRRRRESGPRSDAPSRRNSLSALNRSLLEDLRIYLPSDILFKSDRVAMLHSLEVRVPFLNLPFAEFALRLPDASKVNGATRKYLLKRAMRGRLPRAVLGRPKKGFSVPMDLWLWERGGWREMIYDTIFSRRARERGQFDAKLLDRLRREHERL
ncbi:MAG: asparagine synthase (glutamine-hydrolyzing), partial [Pyrinomonadaceae bacterium]